ncbi:MAG TPA: hypothetical protein VIP11_07160, partial [Gemmatimonadaceae bacterium]
MTQMWEWVFGVVATIVATLLSTADSALLAFHASETSSISDADFVERERLHRALSLGRVLSYIAAGAAFAQGLQLEATPMATRIVVVALVGIAVCTVSEGVGRAIGYSKPAATHARLAGVSRLIALLLRPAVALGAAIDRGLLVVIPPTPANA